MLVTDCICNQNFCFWGSCLTVYVSTRHNNRKLMVNLSWMIVAIVHQQLKKIKWTLKRWETINETKMTLKGVCTEPGQGLWSNSGLRLCRMMSGSDTSFSSSTTSLYCAHIRSVPISSHFVSLFICHLCLDGL